MKSDPNTFMRYEMKYLVTAEERTAIMEMVDRYMQPDEFGKSTICNIYYDTPDMRLIRRSIEKPVYKEKLRLRSYGLASEDGKVYVELKKKYDEVVFKRRVSMKYAQAEKYLAGECGCPKQNQIVSELDYFISKYKGLAPTAYIAYNRVAFFGRDEPDFRITFDDEILWRDYDLQLTKEAYGAPLLNPGQSLMEIKVASAMPLWLSHELSELGVFKVNFSKYGNAYKAMNGKTTQGGSCCA